MNHTCSLFAWQLCEAPRSVIVVPTAVTGCAARGAQVVEHCKDRLCSTVTTGCSALPRSCDSEAEEDKALGEDKHGLGAAKRQRGNAHKFNAEKKCNVMSMGFLWVSYRFTMGFL